MIIISIKDFGGKTGNPLAESIINMLEELFKTSDKVLLEETKKVYVKSEIVDLANDINSLIRLKVNNNEDKD